MRLHRLTIRAFGPFAGTEHVDFDALAASGLFLLHGPTGAGKTSVLDAVCFALYGTVPGARAASTRYRSDHAAEGVAPEVVCEFSVGSRRLEVTRSPAWERPKRRGEGTTTEQARVLVRERDQHTGEWRARTTRLDEAGHLLESLLGMGQAQFTKLVLLPQGDFAAFLRADAETRRQMLEKLFDTDRFSAVQHWLRAEQLQARQEVAEARTVTRELLARAAQAAARLPRPPAAPAPGPPAPGPPGATADSAGAGSPAGSPPEEPEPPAPRDQVAALLARAVHAWEDGVTRRAATQAALGRARAAHQAGLACARSQAGHSRLSAAAQRLAADAGAQAERRRRVRAAERALGIAPVAPVLAEAERRLDETRAHLDACLAAAAADGDAPGRDGTPFAEAMLLRGVLLIDVTVLAGLPDDVLAAQATALRGEAGHLGALAREAAGLTAATAAQQALAAAVEAAQQSLAGAVAGAAAHGPALAAEAGQLSRAEALAAGLPAATQALAAAGAVVTAVAERDRLARQAAAGLPCLGQARDRRDAAREHWLDCRERRLTQMAAELAGALRPGEACPVCGSAEHPAPARPGPGRVTEAEEQQARTVFEDADAELAALTEAAGRLAERLAAVSATAGGITPEEAAERVASARDAVEAARYAAGGIPGRRDTIARLTLASQHAGDVIAAARARLHELETGLATQSGVIAELTRRCDAARGDDAGLPERAIRVTAAAARLEAVLAARRDHTDALRAAATARRTALTAAREAGFGDLAAALAAVVPGAERAGLEQLAQAHDNELAAVTAQLRDPGLAAAAARPAPDVVQLRSAEVLAAGDDEDCARRVADAEHAVAELRAIETALITHLAAAEPLEERHRTLADLSRCADGTGGDNARRMSLSAYVLAARLEEVALAASVRLTQMSGGRYTLEHSGEPARGQRRAGLGLHVADAWTGRHRDTATLSGGESFYTSLALALGLADVLAAEAGGTAIETLFVDEGFGSLDEDTLEEVMDVLDGLRSGGRAVGLVSHLTDLRHRIPAQIEVVKGREGSHLTVAAG
jgi:exonuclease SbcC